MVSYRSVRPRRSWPNVCRRGVVTLCLSLTFGGTSSGEEQERRRPIVDGGRVPHVSDLYFGQWQGSTSLSALAGSALKEKHEARVEFVIQQAGRASRLESFTARVGRVQKAAFEEDIGLRIVSGARHMGYRGHNLRNELVHTYRRAVPREDEIWHIAGRVEFSPAGRDRLHVRHVANFERRPRGGHSRAADAQTGKTPSKVQPAYERLFEYKLVGHRVKPAVAPPPKQE